MSVKAELSTDRRTLTLSIDDSFGVGEMDVFRNAYIDYIYQDMSYVIDFSSVNKIDSSSLGMLLSMRKLVGDSPDISIINCAPQVHRILEHFRVDTKFTIL